MNLKLVLGVGLPLVVAFLLILISVIGGEVTAETNFVETIDASNFGEDNIFTSTTIGTLTLNNDYFLARKAKLPQYFVCMYDGEAPMNFPMSVNYGQNWAGEVIELKSKEVLEVDIRFESQPFREQGNGNRTASSIKVFESDDYWRSCGDFSNALAEISIE